MGIKGLVRGITNCVDPALISMVKMSWGTVESVGDQSEYVSMIATLLTQSVTNVNRAFGSAKYFRVFCDKFVE